MSKVAAATGAHDLDTHHAQARVGLCHHGTLHNLIEGWPAASTVKLGLCGIQGRATTSACEVARFGIEFVVLAGARTLRALFAENVILRITEFCLPFIV